MKEDDVSHYLFDTMALYDEAYGPIEERLILFYRQGLFEQYGIVAGRPCELYNGEQHHIFIFVGMRVALQQHHIFIEEDGIRALSGKQGGAQGTHDEVLRYEVEEGFVADQLIYDMVDDEDELFFQPAYSGRLHRRTCLCEQLVCLVGYELVLDIILVFKIQVEGPFCHTGPIYDIRYGSAVDSLCDKQLVGCVEQGFFLLLFVIIYFPHNAFSLIHITILNETSTCTVTSSFT